MIIDNIFIEALLEQATISERRRANYDLRTSDNDLSQRMLNVLLPSTQIPIHRHKETTETVIVLSGRLIEVFYDENVKEYVRYDLCPADGRFGIQVPQGTWHTIIVSEPCIIFESKDGAYHPLNSDDVQVSVK